VWPWRPTPCGDATREGEALPIISQLLTQSLNHLPWVSLGLLSWGVAYWQLYIVKSETFGNVATLVLSVVPLGIAIVSFVVAVARWRSKMDLAVLFLVLGLISAAYFAWLYFHEGTKVRKVIAERKVFKNRPGRTVVLVIRLLIGAISVFASVALLIGGGWDLIQGSITIGVILVPIGAVVFFLSHFRFRWNFFESCYSALVE
jgi:hypothetical protein